MNGKTRFWKVGELARATGLTIRTLHYYEEIELLRPTVRNDGGHRVCGEQDVALLQKILSLKQLGFPLTEIQKLLRDNAVSSFNLSKYNNLVT